MMSKLHSSCRLNSVPKLSMPNYSTCAHSPPSFTAVPPVNAWLAQIARASPESQEEFIRTGRQGGWRGRVTKQVVDWGWLFFSIFMAKESKASKVSASVLVANSSFNLSFKEWSNVLLATHPISEAKTCLAVSASLKGWT